MTVQTQELVTEAAQTATLGEPAAAQPTTYEFAIEATAPLIDIAREERAKAFGAQRPVGTIEVANQALVKLTKAFRKGKHDKSVLLDNGYLRTVVRNVIRDAVRLIARKAETDLDEAKLELSVNDASDNEARYAASALLERVQDKLDAFLRGEGLGKRMKVEARNRVVAVLALHVQGLSNEDVANELGISKDTVHTDLALVRGKVLASLAAEHRRA